MTGSVPGSFGRHIFQSFQRDGLLFQRGEFGDHPLPGNEGDLGDRDPRHIRKEAFQILPGRPFGIADGRGRRHEAYAVRRHPEGHLYTPQEERKLRGLGAYIAVCFIEHDPFQFALGSL